MGKKIALVLLLALMLGAALWQRIYIKNMTPTLLGGLSRIEKSLEQEDYTQAVQDADAFLEVWLKQKPTYEALFEHDEVDMITATAQSIRSFCQTEERAHALADIEAVKYFIHHIEIIDGVRWQNIL